MIKFVIPAIAIAETEIPRKQIYRLELQAATSFLETIRLDPADTDHAGDCIHALVTGSYVSSVHYTLVQYGMTC